MACYGNYVDPCHKSNELDLSVCMCTLHMTQILIDIGRMDTNLCRLDHMKGMNWCGPLSVTVTNEGL